jgi:hypothetical protein
MYVSSRLDIAQMERQSEEQQAGAMLGMNGAPLPMAGAPGVGGGAPQSPKGPAPLAGVAGPAGPPEMKGPGE